VKVFFGGILRNPLHSYLVFVGLFLGRTCLHVHANGDKNLEKVILKYIMEIDGVRRF
jgi:hypothetical protein